MKKALVLSLTLGLGLSFAVPAFAAKMQNTTTAPQSQQAMMPMAPELKWVKTLQGEDSYSIMRPAFSKDGRYLAANLNETKSIRIWDTQTGDVVSNIMPETLYGTTQLLDGLEFTPDGKHLVVFRAGYPLKQIDWHTSQIVRQWDLGIQGKIEDYAFCPQFKGLAMATPDGVWMWDFEKGQKMGQWLTGQHIHSVDISKDGKWLVFGKQGDIQQTVGMISLDNSWKPADWKGSDKTADAWPVKYPISMRPEWQQQPWWTPSYQVRHVSFEDANNVLVSYMALPEGQFKPTGPAGVFRLNLQTGGIIGPKALSSNMLSFDPVMLGQPFNAAFINTFTFDASKTASAADFVAPDLHTVKTLTDADLNAPMLTFRVSPDQKWMAGSFKETDGKVRVRLYEITPTQPQLH